jgi:hypothetical protein
MSERLNKRRDADHEATPVLPIDRTTTQAVCATCGGGITRLYGEGPPRYRHGTPWAAATFDPDATVRMGDGPRHYPKRGGFTLCGYNWQNRGGRIEQLSDGQRGAVCARCRRIREQAA